MRLTEAAEEVALGIELGLEPQAVFADDGLSGVLATRSSSWWNFRRCKTCGHTFRRGDKVLVNARKRTVEHLVPGLDCGTEPGEAAEREPAPPPSASDDRNEFTQGLLSTWPTEVLVTRVNGDDWRLPRPGGARAPECLFCGHTFRPGEYIVICPCKAFQDAPTACDTAIHRDPAAGLACWENWQPAGHLSVCPTTMARL